MQFRSNTRMIALGVMCVFLCSAGALLQASTFYWDGGFVNLTTPGNGLSEGGAGNWNTSLTNWDNGTAHQAWPTSGLDNDAVFAGVGAAINLASSVAVNELNFVSADYSITGSPVNAITLNGSGSKIVVADDTSVTIGSVISGSVGLTKAGNGTLVFTNTTVLNNNYTGGTFINAGTLAVVADANFGAVPGSALTNITIDGGTLQINTGFNSNANRQVVLGTSNATIFMNSTADFKAQGVISGNGSLTIKGNGLTGSFIPSAANTYHGGTHLGPDVITTPNSSSIHSAETLVSGPYGIGTLFWEGGKFRSASTAYTIGNAVTVTADTTFVSGGTNTLTFSGPISLLGNRVLTAQNMGDIILSGVIGNGSGDSSLALGSQSTSASTIVLTGSNTYTGATTVAGGTLRIGGTSGSLTATNRLVISSGTLIDGDSVTASNAGKTNRLNSSLALELGGAAGGEFTIVGGSSGPSAHQQAFVSLQLGRGVNSISGSSTSITSEANLSFTGSSNNYSRSVGGILNYTSAVGFNPSFTTLPSGSGVHGGVLSGAIYDGTDFIDAASLVFAATNYANDLWSANTQTTITGNNAVPFHGATGSLRFNNTGNATVTLSENPNVIQSGNILVTTNVGSSNATSITGGSLTSGNGADLIVVQNNGTAIANNTTAFPAALTISSSLTDNADSSVGFTKAGTGVVILSGSTANTYSGPTTVFGSGSTANFAPLVLAKPAGTAAIPGNLSIGSLGFAAVYLGASEQIADYAVVDFQGVVGSNAFLQLRGFDETIAGLSDSMGVGVVEIEETPLISASSTLTLTGSANYSFNGTLRNRAGGLGPGVLNLILNGAGSQTLSGGNISYTGSTTIQNGMLNLINASGFASSVAMGNGNATLQISGNTTVSGLSTISGVFNSNASVQNAVGVSSILTINQASDTTFGGILRDNPNQGVPSALGLIKSGNGVLSLTNANSFSGPVTLNGGVLAVGSNGALGTGTINFNGAASSIRAVDSNARTLVNGILLGVNATFGSDSTGDLSFTGPVNLGSTAKSITVLNQTTEFSGVVGSSGTATLTKLGPGNLVMSAPTTYAGATVVTEGTLTWSGNRTANAAAITVGNTNASAVMNISHGNFMVTSDFIVGLGNAGGNAVVNQSGGIVAFANATTQLSLGRTAGSSKGQYNLSSGTLSGQSSANSGITLGFHNDNTGIFQLSGTGNVSMATAMLQIGRSEAPVDGTTGIFNQTGGTASFGKLSIGGSGGGNNDNTTGILNITGGSFSAAAFSSLAGGDTSTATILIGGSANVTLPEFPTTRGLGSTATITFDGGTLRPFMASPNYLSGLDHAYLTGNGAMFNIELGKDVVIAQSFENAPSQVGRLIKQGAGVLTLSGSNSYTGPTTITEGRLVIDGEITSSVEVLANGTLGGSGLIAGNITGTGTVSPGNSLGTLSIQGNYHAQGIQLFEIGKNPPSGFSNDRILIDGELTYDGILRIAISHEELASLAIGDRWDLFDNTGLTTGAFANNHLFGTPGNGFDLPTLGEGFWQFDYQSGVLSIAAVPEPSFAILVILFGAGLLGKRRLR